MRGPSLASLWRTALPSGLTRAGLLSLLASGRLPPAGQPRGAITWGPHVFTYRELEQRIIALHLTTEALLATLILFDANNYEVLRARGDLTVVPRRRRRLDIADRMIRDFAEVHGFTMVQLQELDPETLSMRLKVMGERDNQ